MPDTGTPAAMDPASVLSRRFGLTRRETDVLRLVGARYGNAEIADGLGISKRTVESHVAALFRKLDVPDRPALIRAMRNAGPQVGRVDPQERHRIRAAAARARAESEQQRAVAHDAVRQLLDTVARQRAALDRLNGPESRA